MREWQPAADDAAEVNAETKETTETANPKWEAVDEDDWKKMKDNRDVFLGNALLCNDYCHD